MGAPKQSVDLIAAVLAELSRRTGSGGLLTPVWVRLAGEVVAAAARPSHWEADTLVFKCVDATWRRELEQQRGAWSQRLIAGLPKGTLRDVRFEGP